MTGGAAVVRPLDEADIPLCIALGAARGWVTEHLTWRLVFAAGTGFGVDVDGELVGVVGVSRSDHALATISMLAVSPLHGRRGYARELMHHALTWCGNSLVRLYATAMARPLYLRLGFRPVGPCFHFVGTSAPPVSRTLTSRRMTVADLPHVIALDQTAQGAPRTRLMETMFAHAENAQLAFDGSSLAAFGFACRRAGSLVLGPIVARRTAFARTIAAALVEGRDGPYCVSVQPNPAAPGCWADNLRWASDLGLSVTVEAPVLMVRNGEALPGDRALTHALSGVEFG